MIGEVFVGVSRAPLGRPVCSGWAGSEPALLTLHEHGAFVMRAAFRMSPPHWRRFCRQTTGAARHPCFLSHPLSLRDCSSTLNDEAASFWKLAAH